MVNINIKTKNNIKYEYFIKIIKKGKIRESLFCICDLVCEKYYEKKENKKITILEEKEKIKYVNKVFIKLFGNNENKQKHCLEINLTKISNIFEKNKKNNWKGWEGIVDLNQEDILLIGRKMNV